MATGPYLVADWCCCPPGRVKVEPRASYAAGQIVRYRVPTTTPRQLGRLDVPCRMRRLGLGSSRQKVGQQIGCRHLSPRCTRRATPAPAQPGSTYQT
jgi:hypothetical protein